MCLFHKFSVGRPILRNGERYGDEGKAGDWMRRMGECGSLITPQMLGWLHHPTTFTMHQINQKAKVAFIVGPIGCRPYHYFFPPPPPPSPSPSPSSPSPVTKQTHQYHQYFHDLSIATHISYIAGKLRTLSMIP